MDSQEWSLFLRRRQQLRARVLAAAITSSFIHANAECLLLGDRQHLQSPRLLRHGVSPRRKRLFVAQGLSSRVRPLHVNNELQFWAGAEAPSSPFTPPTPNPQFADAASRLAKPATPKATMKEPPLMTELELRMWQRGCPLRREKTEHLRSVTERLGVLAYRGLNLLLSYLNWWSSHDRTFALDYFPTRSDGSPFVNHKTQAILKRILHAHPTFSDKALPSITDEQLRSLSVAVPYLNLLQQVSLRLTMPPRVVRRGWANFMAELDGHIHDGALKFLLRRRGVEELGIYSRRRLQASDASNFRHVWESELQTRPRGTTARLRQIETPSPSQNPFPTPTHTLNHHRHTHTQGSPKQGLATPGRRSILKSGASKGDCARVSFMSVSPATRTSPPLAKRLVGFGSCDDESEDENADTRRCSSTRRCSNEVAMSAGRKWGYRRLQSRREQKRQISSLPGGDIDSFSRAERRLIGLRILAVFGLLLSLCHPPPGITSPLPSSPTPSPEADSASLAAVNRSRPRPLTPLNCCQSLCRAVSTLTEQDGPGNRVEGLGGRTLGCEIGEVRGWRRAENDFNPAASLNLFFSFESRAIVRRLYAMQQSRLSHAQAQIQTQNQTQIQSRSGGSGMHGNDGLNPDINSSGEHANLESQLESSSAVPELSMDETPSTKWIIHLEPCLGSTSAKAKNRPRFLVVNFPSLSARIVKKNWTFNIDEEENSGGKKSGGEILEENLEGVRSSEESGPNCHDDQGTRGNRTFLYNVCFESADPAERQTMILRRILVSRLLVRPPLGLRLQVMAERQSEGLALGSGFAQRHGVEIGEGVGVGVGDACQSHQTHHSQLPPHSQGATMGADLLASQALHQTLKQRWLQGLRRSMGGFMFGARRKNKASRGATLLFLARHFQAAHGLDRNLEESAVGVCGTGEAAKEVDEAEEEEEEEEELLLDLSCFMEVPSAGQISLTDLQTSPILARLKQRNHLNS